MQVQSRLLDPSSDTIHSLTTRSMRGYASLLALGLATFNLQAQYQPAAPTATSPATMPPASAGLFNDWLREQTPVFNDFDLGGQFRPRFVYQTYFAVPGAGATAVDFRANTPQNQNDFLLLRTRVHADYS